MPRSMPYRGGKGNGGVMAHTAAWLVLPSRAGPIDTDMFSVVKVETPPHYPSYRAAAVLLHYTWPSRFSPTCGSHGTTAAVLWSLSFDIATDGASVCMFMLMRLCVYQVCVRRVCALTQISAQQQHSSSSSSNTTPAVFQALAFVPVVAVYEYVCVVRAQQEVEQRQHLHVQCNNHTHIVGPHTSYTRHATVAQAVAHTCHWDAYVHPFRLACPRDITLTPSRRETL